MKILFTGMASSHCSKPKNVSFFTALSDLLSESAEVVWAAPKFSWTKESLDQFDYIFFGLTPPTSLSANNLYPALNLLSEMFSSPKLVLVADGAQMWQYKNSFEALKRDYKILLGSFYSKRAEYAYAVDNPKFLEKLVAHMVVSPWPKTLYPRLPWDSGSKIQSLLGFISKDSIFGFNLDATLLSPSVPHIGRSDFWSAENVKSSWLEKIQATLSLPISPNKTKRNTDDLQVLDNIERSVGLIIPPQEREVGTWWNSRFIQALNTGTPVITQWQDTINFDPSWGKLGYQIEDMSPAERSSIASQQRYSYESAVPTSIEARQELLNILIESKVER
jgi:hypothetical protein